MVVLLPSEGPRNLAGIVEVCAQWSRLVDLVELGLAFPENRKQLILFVSWWIDRRCFDICKQIPNFFLEIKDFIIQYSSLLLTVLKKKGKTYVLTFLYFNN
jgi:hypothetical protein